MKKSDHKKQIKVPKKVKQFGDIKYVIELKLMPPTATTVHFFFNKSLF